MNEQLAIALAQHLAWPIVAVIALITFIFLRKNFLTLAVGASDLKEMLKDSSGLLKVLLALQQDAKITRETVEILEIKDRSKEDVAAGPATALTLDQMFDAIKGEWHEIVADIRQRADGVGMKTNLVGYVGVHSTVEELVKKGAMSAAAGALVEAVSTRWQPMLRNQSRKSDWLTPQVLVSFQSLAKQAKQALGKKG